jgi:acyl-CoA reductase-like NAD-dependent aldehyde dehydrogenase
VHSSAPSLVEVDDVTTPIVQEEIFGPVATFEVFEDEADAIARANATDYGLTASVWSQDVDRPLRVGRELDAGTVWTDTWGLIVDQMDEGGFENSGMGRLNGSQALRTSRSSNTSFTSFPVTEDAMLRFHWSCGPARDPAAAMCPPGRRRL